ncbi:alpha/beta hydrolase, partial [Solirubrobacter sp. CPCC 204708]|nr:alpha/beta hydrolase [Solirubrobacter deserti]
MHQPTDKNPDTEQNLSRPAFARRDFLKTTGTCIAALGVMSVPASAALAAGTGDTKMSDTNWDKTFPKSDKVDHRKVTFKNRYGVILSADVYQPKNVKGKLPALAVCGPFGAVKEQASGLYAQTMAERGFVTVAFDPSYTGESSGETRNMASPDVNTEDYSAAVDFLGLQPNVDRNRIGAIGICGFSGMALTAATSDSRIKAVATASMY